MQAIYFISVIKGNTTWRYRCPVDYTYRYVLIKVFKSRTDAKAAKILERGQPSKRGKRSQPSKAFVCPLTLTLRAITARALYFLSP